MAPHGKELSKDLKKIIVALHKDGVGYMKIAKTLKLSCSTVAKTIQQFNRTCSTQSAHAQRHIQRLCLGNRRMSAASIASEVERVESMSSAGTGELQFIERTMNANMYCDILKQSMIPSLRRLGRRAVFQHDNDHALLKTLRVKVMDWPSMSPDLNPIEHLWGILKRKVEERKVSNIHQLRDVVMEEWKRTPVATCEALVNSMPKRVKAVLENNGGHTIYWHFGPIWTFSLRGVLTFVASGLDINGCVLSYFEGTANLHCYTSCTLTTLHCSKVSFLQCCHIKR